MSKQKIAVNKIEATMIQAKAFYETALITLDEYLQGTYNEQRKAIENQVFVAEEFAKRSQLAYDSIDRLVGRDLLDPLQLEGEKALVESAQNELDLAKHRLEALEKYTKTKMVVQLKGEIKAAEVAYRAAKASYEEELKLLKEIEDQVAKCVVTAPEDGQVVYATVRSRRGGSEFVVEAGAAVRENQTILNLPDPTKMQVKTTVPESRVTLLREGMPVEIQVDAFRDLKLRGEVLKVNRYAEPGSFWSSNVKEFGTVISIQDPPPGIRVGLTAEVRIIVDDLEEALTVPVQSILERNGRTFCFVSEGEGYAVREVVIDSTDGDVAALNEAQSNIASGDQVVMQPRRHLDLIDESALSAPSDTP